MKLALACAALAALSLSGCSTTSSSNMAPLSTSVGAVLAASDAQIAQVAAKVGTTPCAVFAQAQGYFTVLQPLIPANYISAGNAAIATGTPLCTGTTTGVPSALAKLSAAWVALQNATKAN